MATLQKIRASDTPCLKIDHCIDARCISGHPDAVSDGTVYFQKKVRCHNRQIHKANFIRGGKRKRNQARYEVMGFRLFDKVQWKGRECFLFGRRSTGRMDLRLLDGTKLNSSVGYKNIHLLEMRKNILIRRLRNARSRVITAFFKLQNQTTPH